MLEQAAARFLDQGTAVRERMISLINLLNGARFPKVRSAGGLIVIYHPDVKSQYCL